MRLRGIMEPYLPMGWLLLLVATMAPAACGWITTTTTTIQTRPAHHDEPSSSSDSRFYFAYGSNVLTDTMIYLRNIRNYRNATAAVLPNYKLVFHGAAAVERTTTVKSNSTTTTGVHGVLYELSPSDFDVVSRTEGVPLAYQWQPCRVVPYIGNDKNAGELALGQARHEDDKTGSSSMVTAQTLILPVASQFLPAPLRPRYARPSRSYLEIIQRGAQEWHLDQSYMEYLSSIQPSNQQGPEGRLLQMAKLTNDNSLPLRSVWFRQR
mmetsp:Transcript_28926/g.79374  ORF Transcript_28926/g.79374 Transcript_28926/m.79374 type:complete len:266 (-) Transcript_28926:823-1620(-)